MSNDLPPLQFSRQDLVLLNNALHEILNGPDAIKDWDFHARTGATREEARQLQKRIAALVI